jgi:3-oxoacyl-[acyl-carrier protein] reductase
MSDSDQAAVVTGSSSGIGRAIALRLISAGYAVVVNYSHDVEQAEQTLAECREMGGRAVLERADVSKSDDAARLIMRSVAEFGRVDVLVNNAARVTDKPVLEMSEHDWDSVVDVNMKGAFLCSQAAAREMLAQDEGGTILNIGASTGITARRNGLNTCASKAGLMIMTQCLALELGPKVRVNTIIPGLTVTAETELRFGLSDPMIHAERAKAIPMQRLGQPEDVADAVMLMISDSARFVTGQKLLVNGGQYML